LHHGRRFNVAIDLDNAAGKTLFRGTRYHLTVRKKILTRQERLPLSRVTHAAGYPPAPLTGDVGRDCGDASRALLFSGKYTLNCLYRPTIRPNLERAAPRGEAAVPSRVVVTWCAGRLEFDGWIGSRGWDHFTMVYLYQEKIAAPFP
jgi:hypothetical protein